jgi:hypothetical protein
MAFARPLVQDMAGGERGAILTGTELRRGDGVDAAVAVLLVAPA